MKNKPLSKEELDDRVSNHAVVRLQERFLGHIPNKMTPTVYMNIKTLILRILSEKYPMHNEIQNGIFRCSEYWDMQIVKKNGIVVTVQKD